MSVLVGDIGGTHCRLALASYTETGALLHGQLHEPPHAPPPIHLHDIRRYRNADHAGLADILAAYLGPAPATRQACLAVAGPTDGQQVRFTNLDWQIDCRPLRTRLDLEKIQLINDFAAVGWGLNSLQTSDRVVLQTGHTTDTRHAVKIAVGAGTGLGVSICVPNMSPPDSGTHRPLPTEGGHIGFAPVNEEQDRLLAFMRARHGRVSVERLLSGPGIVDLYRFCLREHGETETHDPLLATNEPAQTISTAALAGEHPSAIQAMRLFVTLYGQVAGDIALASLAQGGVFLAGGIAPQILPLFNAPEFLEAFHAKGRYREWMHSLPVALITDHDIGLKGAAVAAAAR